jgi:hypothetical protein
MLENLLSMEENEKKYHMLKKEDYLSRPSRNQKGLQQLTEI